MELLTVPPEESLIDKLMGLRDCLNTPEATVKEVLQGQRKALDLGVSSSVDPLPTLARLEASVDVLSVLEVETLYLIEARLDEAIAEGDLKIVTVEPTARRDGSATLPVKSVADASLVGKAYR